MAKVEGLLKTFAKQYNKKIGVMGRRDDEPSRIQTGIFALDLATGGGFPEGRVTIIYGPESASKTTLLLKAIAGAQRKYPERKAAFVDVEGHLDFDWAAKQGVDINNLVHIIPENAEQVVDIVEALLAAEDISMVGLDSIAAMITAAELEKTAEELTPGKSGFVVNRLYRKVTHALNDARVEGEFAPTLVVINQIRFKIGVGPGQNPETMPGGPAFLYVSSLTLRLHGKDEGKAEHNKNLPAFKKITGTIRKHKVPIVGKSFEYVFALAKNTELGLNIGDVPVWSTVRSYLQNLKLFVKSEAKAGGWELTHPGTGEVLTFKTQDELKQKMLGDAAFSTSLCEGLIMAVRETGDVIDAE